jgi:hypothetical protein
MMNPTMTTEPGDKITLNESLATDLIVCEVLASRVAALMDIIRLAHDHADSIGPAGRDYMISHTYDLAVKLHFRLASALKSYDAELADIDPSEEQIMGG